MGKVIPYQKFILKKFTKEHPLYFKIANKNQTHQRKSSEKNIYLENLIKDFVFNETPKRGTKKQILDAFFKDKT